MKMKDGLARTRTRIDDGSKSTFREGVPFCEFDDHGEEVGDFRQVLRCKIVQTGNVFFWYHQEMVRGLGVEVFECDRDIVLIFYLAWDFLVNDFAKEAIRLFR